MRQKSLFVIIAITVVAVLSPLVENVQALSCPPPGSCYLQANTNVPSSDATVTVRLDNTTFFTLPHLFNFANDTVHTIEVMNITLRGLSGNRYVWKQWDHCGVQWTPNTMFRTPVMLANYTSPCSYNNGWNGPFSADFVVSPPLGCNANCNLDAQTNVPSNDGTIKVRVDGGTVYSLGTTFPFPNGTVHTIQVLNGTFTGVSSGARYVWKQWDCTCGVSPTTSQSLTTPQMIYNYTFSESTGKNHWGGFTARFDKQFQLTLTFTDSAGQPVGPPTSVTLQSGTSTLILNSTNFSGYWTSALVWTVADATWEGFPMSAYPSQTIDLTTGSAVKSIQLKAYPATIHVVDQNNNPISGATLTVILSNSTSKVFTTDSQGMVQLGRVPAGSYTVQVNYQNQDRGKWTTDASLTQNNIIRLNIAGSTPASQNTAIALLAIFAIAFFLILLALKLRRAPTPPVVGKPESTI